MQKDIMQTPIKKKGGIVTLIRQSRLRSKGSIKDSETIASRIKFNSLGRCKSLWTQQK
jgi:hypothetical protein